MPTSETPTIEERIDILHRQIEQLTREIELHEQLVALRRRVDDQDRQIEQLKRMGRTRHV